MVGNKHKGGLMLNDINLRMLSFRLKNWQKNIFVNLENMCGILYANIFYQKYVIQEQILKH